MLYAITRSPAANMANCLLTHMEREPINDARAREQHDAYRSLLAELGAEVMNLPASEEHPDAVFVEDNAFVTPEFAIIAPMGADNRRGEQDVVHDALAQFREIVVRLEDAARLEGGDIFMAGREIFVGLSTRSDERGLRALAEVAERHDYRVTAVHVTGCLHLSTGASCVAEGTILLNPDWVDARRFQHYRCIETPQDEPWAANALRIGELLVLPAECPKTADMLRAEGFIVHTTPISEFAKAEAGLTCMSIVFESGA